MGGLSGSSHGEVIARRFTERFGHAPVVVARAPGRVNLIGEHVDYNDGLVLPIALEQSTHVAAAPRSDGVAWAVSLKLGREHTWSMSQWEPTSGAEWTAYVAGVTRLLAERGGAPRGFDLLIDSDVPVGGGLSSSAALELATTLALAHLAGLRLSPVELARLAHEAERRYAGVPCGIMDQYVGALARPGAALLLDCRSQTWDYVPLELAEHDLVVVDSGIRHALASGDYARRREECRAALTMIQQVDARVRSLREVTSQTLAAAASTMTPALAARARHVVGEIERVRSAAAALSRGELRRFGELLGASHASLRDDFMVSTPEIDRLVDIAGSVPGVLGARLTGGGFGGCVIVLVESSRVESLRAAICDQYDRAGLGPARLMSVRAAGAASIVFDVQGTEAA
ncbi:MAG: galactokinase [Phycisphaerales bacterium]|nr:galactokinase [Phycisphaerales bacterium]